MNKEQKLTSSGLFRIDLDGSVWRVGNRHGRGVKLGGGYNKGATTSPCEPRRAEYLQRDGYLLVTATINGTRVVTGAHRLVWHHFNGPIPDGVTINHKNGHKADNRPENLELATYSEQRKHALFVLGRRKNHPKGSLHPKTNLTESEVKKMRDLRSDGMMVKDIAARYKMRPRAVSAICTRRTWKHV